MLVYEYNSVYNRQDNKYTLASFKKYAEGDELHPVEEFNIDSTDLPYYTYSYNDTVNLYEGKMLLSNDPFLLPLDHFKRRSTLQMSTANAIDLKHGFNIQEEISYGFVFSRDDEGDIIWAKKYGLKNTKTPDYDAFITEYKVIHRMLIVYNRFMENYNYIASGKDIGRIMTQDNLYSGKLIPNIYLVDNPCNIIIADKGKTESEIDIKYDENGVVKSFVMNGEELCKYKHNNTCATSEHPILYEPFYLGLYEDILVNKVDFYVKEIVSYNDLYNCYRREVYKK